MSDAPSRSALPAALRDQLRWSIVAGALALALAGCGSPQAPDGTSTNGAADASESAAEAAKGSSTDDEAAPEPANEQPQAETCDWDAPKVTTTANAPEGQEGELSEALIGAWQHTHTDEGAGFEAVTNDHRYIIPSPDRMLYCQHVPGATEYAENAADVTLNGTTIELPGGKYGYTVLAWDEDSMLWDNPVGGGYVYLLQRR
ncbi:MAG: hypothetical protein ACTIJ6_06895 [Leucobacter sp.]